MMSVRPKQSPAREILAGACLAFLVLLAGCDRGSNEYVEPPPPEVTVTLPVEADITPFIEENGITEASEEAEVRARVKGFIQAIEFQPGQLVEKGAVLYRIEPDQYEAAVESASAAVEAAVAAIGVAQAAIKTAEAEVEKTKQDLGREERLKTQNASSQAQYDAASAAAIAAVAALDSANANVKSSEAEKSEADAALRQAELDLGYTTVHAEIGGRITKTNFKLGNLVENGSHLATVVDDDQIFANFSVSDRSVLRFMKARKAAAGADAPIDEYDERDWRDTPVYLGREGDEGFPFDGVLNYVDQAGVQSRTGTLGLRAIFKNPRGALLPGLFVRLRVPAAAASKSMVIPERAVLRDQQGPYVLVVGAEDKVERKRVDVGQAISGWAILSGGLNANDRVVVEGIQFARPTSKVVPEEMKLSLDGEQLLRGMATPDDARTDDTDGGAQAGQTGSVESENAPAGSTQGNAGQPAAE